jgi:SAM-dependent methyltransferase
MADWFEEWFDSPFYHILYKSRNEREAHLFIDNLIKKLAFNTLANYCDMACGKGRHAVYLNQRGFETWGLDLSPNNIAAAKKMANDTLHFAIHDIRKTYKPLFFDVVLNLFTSFGYFEGNVENQKAISAMAESLKPGGILILDYMNSRKAIEEFEGKYEKTVDGIRFNITKRIEKGFIFKQISFDNSGNAQTYEERVKLLLLDDFKTFFSAANLNLEYVFGDYSLGSYHDLKSERMIMVCKKKST